MSFSKPRVIVKNGKCRIVNRDDNQRPLEERVNQLTTTVENLQKMLDRFIALYESEKVAALSKQEGEEKSNVDTIVMKVSEKDKIQTENDEICKNIHEYLRVTGQSVAIEESQKPNFTILGESAKEIKWCQVSRKIPKEIRVQPEKTDHWIDPLKTQKTTEQEEKGKEVSVDMEQFDNLRQQNLNLKISIEKQTAFHIREKLKWEEERDKLQKELQECKYFLENGCKTTEVAPTSEDVLKGHTNLYECNNCSDFSTYSKVYFECHRNIDCSTTPKYECNICNKQFLHKDNYENHTKLHDSVERTRKDVVFEQMKAMQEAIVRNKRRQEIRLEYECQFNAPQNATAIESNQKECDQEKPVVRRSANVSNEEIKIEKIQKAAVNHSKAVDEKDMSFSPQLLETLKQQSINKQEESIPLEKVSDSEEINWIRSITSKPYVKPIYVSSAVFVPSKTGMSWFLDEPNETDKQKPEGEVQESNAENEVIAIIPSGTKQSEQAKQQTSVEPATPLVLGKPETEQNSQDSVVVKNTQIEDKETGETMQGEVQTVKQNMPHVIPFPPWTEPQLPMPLSNNLIDENIRRNLRQRFTMQLITHNCESSCTFRTFVNYMEHASKCTYGAECTWYICKRVHDKVEHLKVCQDKTDCAFCKPYVEFNEGRMIGMIKVLEQGCPQNSLYIRNVTTTEAIMTMISRLAVNYGLLGDDETIDDEEMPDVSEDVNEDDQLSDSPADEIESNSSSSSSSSSSTSGKGTSSEEWEVIDPERRAEVD